jgi:hypothetical protein
MNDGTASQNLAKSAQMVIALLALAGLAGCGERDEIARVTCEAHSAQDMVVQISVPSLAPKHTFLLNRNASMPGALLQFSAGEPQRSKVVHVIVAPKGGYGPSRVETFGARIHSGYFEVDAQTAANAPSSDSSDSLPEYLTLWFEEARRVMLNDPIEAMNADRSAAAILRDAPPETRFAVVSAVWIDDHVDVWTSFGTLVGQNTLQREQRYIHLDYACAPLAPLWSPNDAGERMEQPLLLAYLPVRYDPTTGLIVADEERADSQPVASAR